jgi:hypothetical protein
MRQRTLQPTKLPRTKTEKSAFTCSLPPAQSHKQHDMCGTCSMNTNCGQWICTILMGKSQGKTRHERTNADEGERGRGSWYKLPGSGSPDGGPDTRLCSVCFSLSGSIRCNYVAIWRVYDAWRQRPSCLRSPLLCFLTFYLVGPSLLGRGGRKNVFTGTRTRSRRFWTG